MRNGQTGLVDVQVVVQQQVEVDRPRPPARADALAPEPPLHVEQVVEERARRERRLDLRGGVQERRLRLVAPRLRLVQRREPPRTDQLGGAPDQLLAVAEVGAEADVGERQGRWTITAECSTPSPAGCLRTRSFSRSGPNRA